MREHREPWLKVPEKDPGSPEEQRLDAGFRTHVVTVHGGGVAARAQPPPGAPIPAPPVSPTDGTVLPFSPAVATRQKPPAADRAEPALSMPALAQRPASRPNAPAPPAQRNADPAVAAPAPRPAPKRTGVRVPGAPPLGINDLPVVSSADWVAKVGEAAKMVDVVVVFYRAAYLGSEMFEAAFQMVVNELLPRMGRPYAVYRFSLDAEPRFVSEMAESLGLPRDNPVTAAGFAWSGPGRRLLVIGDRALQSRTALSRFLRESLDSRQGGARQSDFAELERRRERELRLQASLLGRRALAIVAWCLFGTAALAAAVVSVKPQWASSLLHSATAPTPIGVPNVSPQGSHGQTNVAPPAPKLDIPAAGTPDEQAQAPVNSSIGSRPVHRRLRKIRVPRAATYWGLPEDQGR